MNYSNKKNGFTLVEMLISVGIFTVMSAIILANYPEFRSRSALDNLTNQVALVFKEAQIYGISVREEGEALFDTGYGVYVSGAGTTQLLLFADKNKNKAYDPDEQIDVFSLNTGETISRICAPTCLGEGNTGSTLPPEQPLSVVFIRPNPDAYFSPNNTYDMNIPSVSLRLSNRSGSYQRYVEIYTTGQISVR